MRPFAIFSLVLLFSPGAQALGPGEQAYSVELGGVAAVRPETHPGAGLGVSYARGLTDVMALRGSLGTTWLARSDRKDYFATQGAIGLTFALDALSYVPYVDLALAGADFRSSDNASQWLGTRVEAGMDYLLSRHTGFGLGLRGDFSLIQVAGPDLGRFPIHLSLALRLARYF